MGSKTFMTTAFGKSPNKAFEKAVEDAEYHHGKAGYTGTIAEKDGFKKIPESEHKHKDKRKYAWGLINGCDKRIDGKMEPAGAISLKGTKEAKRFREGEHKGKHGTLWLFFGWAAW